MIAEFWVERMLQKDFKCRFDGNPRIFRKLFKGFEKIFLCSDLHEKRKLFHNGTGRLEISQMGKQIFAIFKLHSIGSTNGRYCRKDFCLRRPIESFFVDTHAQPPLPYELGKIRVYHRGQIHPQFFCEALRLRLHLRIDSYAGCHGCHK